MDSEKDVHREVNYYCAGITAFFDEQKKTINWHVVQDAKREYEKYTHTLRNAFDFDFNQGKFGDMPKALAFKENVTDLVLNKKIVNMKFPGGRAHEDKLDLDEEIWGSLFTEFLNLSDFTRFASHDEAMLIQKDLREKKRSKQERTFLREFMGETGYYPLEYEELPPIHKGGGHVQYFFLIHKLIGPHWYFGPARKDVKELHVADALAPAHSVGGRFIPSDISIVDGQYMLSTEEMVKQLVGSHQRPFKGALRKIIERDKNLIKNFYLKNSSFCDALIELGIL